MNRKITVMQTEPGSFLFLSEQIIENGKLYLTNSRAEYQTFLREVSGTQFHVELPDFDGRPYFLLIEGDRQYMLAERNLPVSGMNNFRDMGGYETADGRRVKWGVLYRSDHIYNADEQGVEYLKKLGIHTIVDYRSKDEVSKYPNKDLGETVRTYRLDPEAHTAELSAQFTSSKADEDKNLVNKIIEQKKKGHLVNQYDIVMEQYHNFVYGEKSRNAFGQMLKIAANPDAPALVQHCRGGKDRTGYGCALLLGTLGVTKDQLVEDYMLTYTNRLERNNVKMEIYKKYTDDPDVLNYLYSLIETRPEFIQTSIEAMEAKFGSIREYAESELGVTRQEIEQLKTLYLE